MQTVSPLKQPPDLHLCRPVQLKREDKESQQRQQWNNYYPTNVVRSQQHSHFNMDGFFFFIQGGHSYHSTFKLYISLAQFRTLAHKAIIYFILHIFFRNCWLHKSGQLDFGFVLVEAVVSFLFNLFVEWVQWLHKPPVVFVTLHILLLWLSSS